jgi:RHS repeat-associated protein
MTRHDYLPFGEEIGFGVGGRTAEQGYVYDGLRKQFGGNERDPETNLDFAQARYYSFTQGRFTSPDPLTFTQRRAIDPQQLNLYSYVRNDPLNFIDPDGKDLVAVTDPTGETYEIPEDKRRTLQRELSRLAPGTKVDKQGRVHKPGFFRRLVNKATGHGQGTSLISRLVDSDKTTGIVISNADSSVTMRGTSLTDKIKVNGVKPAALIFWGSKPGTLSSVRTADAGGRVSDTSPIRDAPTPSAITLGHELIHADHIVNGTYSNTKAEHTFREGSNTYSEQESEDEFRAVGFAGFTRKGDITENQLRKELGLRPRAAYNSRGDWKKK